jgi:hypothetical protein
MARLKVFACGMALCSSSALLMAVPSAPSNLTAIVSGNTIFITWNAPPTPILGFVLQAGLAPGTTIAGNTLAPNPSGLLNGFTATPIPPGTYYLRVHAFDATGLSAPSNEAIAVVGGGSAPCVGPPAAPTGLAANVAGFFVTLGFNPGGGGCPAINYALHAGSGPGLSNITIANLGTQTGLSTLAPPGIYFVRVFAQGATGTSGPSNEIVVRVGVGDTLFRR